MILRLGALLAALLCWPAAWAGAPLAAQGTIEVLFTPWDDAEGALLRTIGQARSSIHIQSYTFSSRNIAWALGEAKKRGVRIEMLADREQVNRNQHSLVHSLHDSGISIWFEVRYAAAHNKVMLIDAESRDPVLVTGSYNFTFSAQARNSENLLIVRDNPPLVRAYFDNWQRHRQDAVPYSR